VRTLTTQLRASGVSATRLENPSTPGSSLEKDWNSRTNRAADENTEMAPVQILRRQGPLNAGIRRLLDATDDIIIQGLLSAEQAYRLEVL